MLTSKDFNDRCSRLYDNMRNRFKPKVWKAGKRAGKVKTPGRELPFDRDDVRRFMAKEIGLCAKSCRYCGTPIDILTLQLDHKTPIARGGGLGFDNLECICADCNRQKGELTVEEFLKLMDFLKPLAPAAQSDIRARLKGRAMRFSYPKKPKAKVPRYKSPQLSIDDNF